jgi:hypothetical protein
VVEFVPLRSTHTTTHILSSNHPASLHFIPLRSIPVVHSGHCFIRKKTALHKAKIAPNLRSAKNKLRIGAIIEFSETFLEAQLR